MFQFSDRRALDRAFRPVELAGHPGQFGHPQFQEALAQVLAACSKHGKTPGFIASSITVSRQLFDQGFRMLAYSGDLWIYQAALREGVAALQNHGSGGSP